MKNFQVFAAILRHPKTTSQEIFKEKATKFNMVQSDWEDFFRYLESQNDVASAKKLIRLGLAQANNFQNNFVNRSSPEPSEVKYDPSEILFGIPTIPWRGTVTKETLNPDTEFKSLMTSFPNSNPGTHAKNIVQFLKTFFDNNYTKPENKEKFLCDLAAHCSINKNLHALREAIETQFNITIPMLNYWEKLISNPSFHNLDTDRIEKSLEMWQHYRAEMYTKLSNNFNFAGILSLIEKGEMGDCFLSTVRYPEEVEKSLEVGTFGYIIYDKDLFYRNRNGGLEYLTEIDLKTIVEGKEYKPTDVAAKSYIMQIYAKTSHRLPPQPENPKLTFVKNYRDAVYELVSQTGKRVLTDNQKMIIEKMSVQVQNYYNAPQGSQQETDALVALHQTLSPELRHQGRNFGQKYITRPFAKCLKTVLTLALGALGGILVVGGAALLGAGGLIIKNGIDDVKAGVVDSNALGKIILGSAALAIGLAAIPIGSKLIAKARSNWKEPTGPGFFSQPNQSADAVRMLIEMEYNKNQKIAPTKVRPVLSESKEDEHVYHLSYAN